MLCCDQVVRTSFFLARVPLRLAGYSDRRKIKILVIVDRLALKKALPCNEVPERAAQQDKILQLLQLSGNEKSLCSRRLYAISWRLSSAGGSQMG